MLESYEPKNYTVVTQELILTLANQQQSKLKRKHTITELDQVEQIRLEYLNILQITCLWPLKNLVKLKLNNNAIEKIENLEALKNLCELDLSFNRIKVMENMESLANIHILSFYDNQIEVLQGLDAMTHLTILSMGKNFIKELDHVVYLRQFKELQSIQMTKNPCTEQQGYVSYLLAFVPQLRYYGYKLITKKELADAEEKHARALAKIVEEEVKRRSDLEAVKKVEEKVAQQSLSYVEYLDNDTLFQKMYEADEDGKSLLQVCEDLRVSCEVYRKNFSAVCQGLYELGLKEEIKRRNEIKALNDVIEEKLKTATQKSRKMLESVEGKKNEITVRVTQLLREASVAADDADLDDDAIDEIDKVANQLSWEFNDYISNVWSKLMRDETILHEQIEEMSKTFEINLTDLVSGFLEQATEGFSQLRSLETEFSENTLPMLMNYFNNVEEDEKEADPFMSYLMEDKDAVMNLITGSHFMHLGVIDDRQDSITKRLKEWQAKFLQTLMEDETKRSRSRVLEITHFLDYHRKNATVARLLGHHDPDSAEDKESEQDEVSDKKDDEDDDDNDDDGGGSGGTANHPDSHGVSKSGSKVTTTKSASKAGGG